SVSGLNISSGGSTGLNAVGTSASHLAETISQVSVTTTTGTAVNLSFVDGSINLTSVTSTTASGSSGIVLNTTTGNFAVAGGTISNKTVAGVSLTSASNVSLSSMNIQNNGKQAISGTGVNGFSLTGCSITGNNGNGVASVDLTDTTGTVSFVNDT